MRIAFTLVVLPTLFISQSPPFTVSGRVTSRSGTAVAGAVVSVKREGGIATVSVYADASGRYHFTDLPDGRYTLRVAAPGFATASQPIDRSPADVRLEPLTDVWETAPSARLLSLLPDGETKRKFILDCTGCHQFDRQTVSSAAGGGLKSETEWRERTAQMIGFAGGRSGFPIMSPSRDADSTAAWLVRTLGTVRPVLAATGGTPAPSATPAARITEYELPAPNDLPHDLIVAPDGDVVITGMFTHRMYLLDPAAGAIRTEAIPVQNANPRAVEIGPDGTWWVLLGNPRRIARRAPDGAWTSWDVGMYGHSIGIGGDGRVWTNGHFTRDPEVLAGLDPATGSVVRHEVPTPAMPDSGSTIPYELRMAPDGAVWVSQLVGGRLVRFDPAAGRFQLFPLPAPFSGPRRIDIDRAGRVWIPEYARNRLSRFDPATERFTDWELPVPDALPYVVRLDEDRGALWIGTGAADALIRFDLATERFTVFPLPTPGAMVRHLDVDRSNGDVWLAYGASPGRTPARIARVNLDP
jgi:virginiamycin B lyase